MDRKAEQVRTAYKNAVKERVGLKYTPSVRVDQATCHRLLDRASQVGMRLDACIAAQFEILTFNFCMGAFSCPYPPLVILASENGMKRARKVLNDRVPDKRPDKKSLRRARQKFKKRIKDAGLEDLL